MKQSLYSHNLKAYEAVKAHYAEGNPELAKKYTDDVELDGNRYNILTYELRNGHVSITPCPYKEAPKPKVGSSLCASCGSFHGRNRSKRQVACSAVSWKPWMKECKV